MAPRPRGKLAAVRIATWNVNGLRARLEFALHWLRERRPGLVGLQELKLSGEHFPHAAFAEAGYRAAVHGQKSWNGVAILCREDLELEVLQTGLPGQGDFGARLLSARAAGLAFTTVYCPNGKNTGHEDFPRKLAWFDALAEHLAGQAERTGQGGRAELLVGDFNIVPAALDSWNEKELAGSIFHTGKERARLQALLALGFCDLFREKHPELRAFSWWDYRGGAFHRGQGLRIDLLLGSPDLRARLRSVQVDRDWRKKRDGLTASDHAPVVADLDWPWPRGS